MTTLERQEALKRLLDKYAKGEISSEAFYTELAALAVQDPQQFEQIIKELEEWVNQQQKRRRK